MLEWAAIFGRNTSVWLCCQVNSTPLAARKFSEWRQEVLLHMNRILTEAGASVAPSMADLALPT